MPVVFALKILTENRVHSRFTYTVKVFMRPIYDDCMFVFAQVGLVSQSVAH